MNHALLVHILDRFHDLLEDSFDLVFVLDPRAMHLPDVLVKIASIDVFDNNGHFIS